MLRTLKSYCDSQHLSARDEGLASCFPDLTQTWNFADSNNDEPLLSLIPSVLALFLKAISSQLEFREFGLDLCKFLLQKEQLKLFNRGFTASKVKDHLISPCLRLLTEIVSFDGGAVARIVYSKRDITLKRLDIFLGARKSPTGGDTQERRRPTLRRISQRYLLANFRFQNATAKEDLIGQGKLLRAFLEDIRRDAPDIVLDIIRSLDKDIISDDSLSRNAKSRFLNRWNLERLVTLYGFEEESDERRESVSDGIHKFLLAVCTSPEKGVLLPETGWYPFGSNPDVLPSDGEDSIRLGLDSLIYFDKYEESVPVRNGNLSTLIQFLRPDSDTLQTELLLEIFKAAPELVFDFFSKRTMFTSDPKPTPNWLGESAFLFSTVQLPVLLNCGWKGGLPMIPPPVSVVVESILPRPLTQKILTRCINQSSDVVTLFGIRITTLALRKLQVVLKIFRAEREIGQDLWNQASEKLVDQFCRRCPSMRDVISLFRQVPKNNLLQQEASLGLISVYFQVVPMLAFEERFDISLILVDVLNRLDNTQNSEQGRELLLGQLQHLLNIAQQSPAMRWWQKPG
jgi:nucleolar pre-ribosomal-associated protein 1